MKIESATRQPKYILEPLEPGRVRVILFANETPIEAEDGTHYVYDRYVQETVARESLGAYISGNLDAWIAAYEEAEIAEVAAAARAARDKLLQESDKEMVLDRMKLEVPTGSTFSAWLHFLISLGNVISGTWARYRQALRDIPEQPGFPYEIEWPEKPHT